jgi:putative tributyrin esterase
MSYLRINIKAESIGQSIEVEAYLPNYMKAPGEQRPPFKTLYFLPGFAASAKESLTFMNMQLHAMNHGIALISFSGERSFYLDQPDIMENYGKFVGEELIELTRKLLPISDRREDTYLGGISMGGYGAIRNGMKYADTFSKVIMLSPAVWYPNTNLKEVVPVIPEKIKKMTGGFETITSGENAAIAFVDEALKEKKTLPELFLRCGMQDELVYPDNLQFLKDLERRGIPIDYEEADGMHDLTFWSKMMPAAFDFLSEYIMEEEDDIYGNHTNGLLFKSM